MLRIPLDQGIEQVQVLPCLDGAHGIARASRVFVIHLEHPITPRLLSATQQRRERPAVQAGGMRHVDDIQQRGQQIDRRDQMALVDAIQAE
jgi:hypothetical protein